MKISSILVCITMVGIVIEICKAKYFLVEIDDAKKTGNASRLNNTADLLKERIVTELAKENTRYEGNNCVYWRQTTACHPNGPRDPINDKSCNEAVPADASGFCECQDNVRTMPKECKKGKFQKCNDACNIEWLTFMHVKREMHIGKPEKWDFGEIHGYWDSGNIDKQSAGEHMITDKDGNPLKLSEVNDGMKVKIVAKDVHFEGWQYLYTSRNAIPGYGYCYYDLFRDIERIWMRQQTWTVKIEYSNSERYGSFRFESNYWKNNYLNANEGKWLYVDNDENPWWRIYRA